MGKTSFFKGIKAKFHKNQHSYINSLLKKFFFVLKIDWAFTHIPYYPEWTVQSSWADWMED